jgi:2-dehydro-3-deoxyphosphogluconate aldolase / (4S)-4-hydroxy-2-oxoglutarate aldolase
VVSGDSALSGGQPQWFTQALAAHPVMAILRGYEPARAVELAQRAWDLGVALVEVPVQSASSLAALEAVAAAGRERGLAVGAGTVIEADMLVALRAAGAVFAVSPGIDPDVIRACTQQNMAALPGVATATDIQLALRLGLQWVKAFPASVLGPGWFRAMRGPFPQMAMVATGGIDAGNAAAYLDAGAAVLGVGSALEDERQLEQLAALR